MFDGRLPSFANTRSMRVAGRPRHGGARGRRCAGNLRPAHPGRRRAAAHREPLQALSSRAAPAVHPRASGIRRGRADRLPFDAVDRRPPGRAAARRNSCSATATARAASAWWRRSSRTTLRSLGYTVSRNKPYAGGFITEHYGNPAAGLHAIQLEINRALYMDERRYERSPTFRRLAADLETLARRLGEIPAGGTAALPRRGRISLASLPKKGPLAASGPSLGRKRPRRAAVASGATALQ